MSRRQARTHTQQRDGGGSGREQGQPATANNAETRGKTTKADNRLQAEGAHNKAGRKKEKGGRGGRRNTQEPDPGTQKSKQRKAELATKQKHSSETAEAG
jgi:hypothetical protein